MKHLKLFALLLLSAFAIGLTFASCDDDDDDDGKSGSSIVGTWSYKESRNDYITITFNRDGSGMLTVVEDGEREQDRFEWETEGRRLYIYYDGYTDDYEIMTFRISGNSLTLTGDYGYSVTLTRS